MAWNAKLTEVEMNVEKDLDYIEAIVQFTDGTTTKDKTYKVYAGQLANTTIADFKAIVQVDLDKLNKLETFTNVLKTKIGATL
jgi:rubrerythrin